MRSQSNILIYNIEVFISVCACLREVFADITECSSAKKRFLKLLVRFLSMIFETYNVCVDMIYENQRTTKNKKKI